MASIGWYGPLIDLSQASSHVGHFVQLLVLVHRTIPVQYKTSGGGKVIRTDIQVGDETRPYFPVSIWQKNMESMLKAGNIVLLQNVKVTKFGDAIEARTVQQSSIRCLVDTSICSEGSNKLVKAYHIGIAMKEKLEKVTAWVRHVEPIIDKHELHNLKARSMCMLEASKSRIALISDMWTSSNQKKISWIRQPISLNLGCMKGHNKRNKKSANWKLPEEMHDKDCLSLMEVSNLNDSCNASFFGSICEMFLPITTSMEFEEEKMFIRNRLCSSAYGNIPQDLICTGCQSCGAPLISEFSPKTAQESVPLYCQRSSNRLHVVSLIYRPFLLYLWDEFTYIPVVVKNKAAEILFGNIKAESVHSSYRKQSCGPGLNFYSLWVTLLKTILLQPGKNSPLKFKVRVDMTKDRENGRFEMLSVSFPLLLQ